MMRLTSDACRVRPGPGVAPRRFRAGFVGFDRFSLVAK